MISHRLKQIEAPHHVIAIVLSWINNRLADIGEGSEVNNSIRPVFQKHFVKPITIKYVTLLERPPFDCALMSIAKVVESHR